MKLYSLQKSVINSKRVIDIGYRKQRQKRMLSEG
jgi:hypothetical protein